MTKFIQIKIASKELHTEQTEEGGSTPNSNIAVAATGISKNVEHSQARTVCSNVTKSSEVNTE